MARRWVNRPEGANWGDFGDDDQIGRMNLLTPERRRDGIREAREGIAFTLSLPLDYPGWDGEVVGRRPPKLFTAELGGEPPYNMCFGAFVPGSHDLVCDDAVVMFTQYSTQWDSLAHWGRLFDADGDGVPEPLYYNAFRAEEHLKGPAGSEGPYARRLGIENLAMAGVQGRASVVDLHAVYGDEPESVGYDGLMRAMEAQNVDVRAGDFLLVHTGWDDKILSMNRLPDRARMQRMGPSLRGRDPLLLDWITTSGIVAICSDNPAVETVVGGDDACAHGESFLPLHEHCLFKQGIHLGEMWQLSDLATWLRQNDRSACLLTAPPLRLPGSVGSPVTPVATV
jgi:kynurenine formamidase